MTSPEANLEVVFSAAEDVAPLIQLYGAIADSVVNKAYFNWNQEKVASELIDAKTLIARDVGCLEIVAFVTYRDYGDRFEISAIGTNPKHLKRGFAQKVLLALQANAAQRKLAIWLEVHENNQTAVNLYLKNGFSVLNTRKRYYPDGGHALVMQFTSG